MNNNNNFYNNNNFHNNKMKIKIYLITIFKELFGNKKKNLQSQYLSHLTLKKEKNNLVLKINKFLNFFSIQ